MYDRLAQLITYNYNKSKESNIGKLFLIITEGLDEVKDTLNKVEDYRDVDIATGKTLDKLGGNVKQYRGIATDEIYRILIKSKQRSVNSQGDINSIISIITDVLDVEPSTLAIKELYDEVEEEPAAIKILSVPLKRLAEIGLSSEQFIQIVERSIPAGVRIAELRLEGTFEFSGVSGDFDTNKGFGDSTNPIVGGTLGATYSSGQNEKLPI